MPEAEEFIADLPDKAREKMFFNIRKVKGGVKDPELFKKIDDAGIWEFRTLWMGMAYRLLAFWDKDGETLVVATHGLFKENAKDPQKRKRSCDCDNEEYFDNKIK